MALRTEKKSQTHDINIAQLCKVYKQNILKVSLYLRAHMTKVMMKLDKKKKLYKNYLVKQINES